MSKRPITYSPDTPERPAKRRQVSRSAFSGSTYTGYEQPPQSDPMEEDEVTSSLKRDRDYWNWYNSGQRREARLEERPAKRQNIKLDRPFGIFGQSGQNKRKAEDQEPVSKAEVLEELKDRDMTQQFSFYDNRSDIPYHTEKRRMAEYEVPTNSVAPTESVAPTAPRVVPGMPEPSTTGYKMSSTSKMATTQYKYLHVDSQNRLTHETNSKVNVNFGGLPIENIKRVGVVKATITNTGHNVFEGHDQVKIAVRIGNAYEYATFTLDHDYYTLTQMLTALNTKVQAYTNSDGVRQQAVRDLRFEETADEKVEIKFYDSRGTPSSTEVSYALIVDHKTDRPNTLLLELGFDKSSQTLDPDRYTQDYMTGNLHRPTNAIVRPSQYFGTQLWYNYADGTPADHGKDKLEAHNRYTSENTKGFYLCSQALTAGGNVLKAQVTGNGRAVVQHDDHLVFIPNKALRDEYNQYETNVIEWVDVYGDLHTFDLEVRNHLDKPLVSTNNSATSASPPFLATLIFECETERAVFGTDTLAYHREAYLEAHRQN